MALITNPAATAVIKVALRVHSALGPGLFESVYEDCTTHELRKLGLSFQRQVALPLTYDGRLFPRAFIADLIVEGQVLVELKSIERLLPIHSAQILTYMRIANIDKGLLINFNSAKLKDGLKSFIRGSLAHQGGLTPDELDLLTIQP